MLAGDDVFDAGEALFARLEDLHGLLTDPNTTSIRVVLTLEQVVIAEAQRSFTYFHLYGYLTDLVIANRVLPDEVGEYFRGWFEAQQRYGPLVDNTFHPIPVRKAPYFDQEVVGMERLRQLQPFADVDLTDFFYRGRPYEVTRDNGTFLLSVDLPFTEKRQINPRRADELIIDLGSWRRTLVLPRILVDAPTEGARLRGRHPEGPLWESRHAKEPAHDRLPPPTAIARRTSSAASPRSSDARRAR